jgi:hypothetical protein
MQTKVLAQAVKFSDLFNDLKSNYQFDPSLRVPGLLQPQAINVAPAGQVRLADIVSAALPYTYLIAGLILFLMLIWAGFEMLTAGDNQETVKRASGRITQALTGFGVVFLSYWLIRLVELILGVKIF